MESKRKIVWLSIGKVMERELGAPTMIYDAPTGRGAKAKIAKMQGELAVYNFKVVVMATKYPRIYASPLNYRKRIPKNWLHVVDEIVFDNGGGCQ